MGPVQAEPSVVSGEGPGRSQGACSACGSRRVRTLWHSSRWNFDVGGCRDCGTAFALDARSTDEVESRYDNDQQDEYVDLMREPTAFYESVLAGLRTRLATRPEPMVFDVGAGTGEFLATARESGFRVSGNELTEQAAQYTFDRHGIEINTLRLADQEAESVDALTMWCVIAHIPDPKPFLREALAMLRPGGVLFLRTPRWCIVDTLAMLAGKATRRGRSSNLSDWRVTPAHLHLFTDDGLRAILSGAGFTQVEVTPTSHFGFDSNAYVNVAPLGPLRPLARIAAAAIDRLIARNWFIRNTAFVYARRPAT